MTKLITYRGAEPSETYPPAASAASAASAAAVYDAAVRAKIWDLSLLALDRALAVK